MKYWSILTLFLTSIHFGWGQTQVIEVEPEFSLSLDGWITSPIAINIDASTVEFVRLSSHHLSDEEHSLHYRIKTEQKWSSWVALDRQYEYVAPGRVAYSTSPISKSFSAIQFKSNHQVEKTIKFRLFIADPTKTTAIQQIQPQLRSNSCELPEVCNRNCWCPSCPIDVSPQLTEPTHLIVHHSAGNNQSSNFGMVVQSIWDLHVNNNGWDDIGYNWLIDPNGILYEGRPDGYQGAHFSCINENTVGICVIGNYTHVPPSSQAMQTLTQLLAHEATNHDINAEGRSFHTTGDFLLENIAGHRDSEGSGQACSSTVCPGDSFYPLLTQLRQDVANLPCYGLVSSIQHQSNDSLFQVYPNPAQNRINIKSSRPQRLSVYNIHGTLIDILDASSEYDISHWSSGIYCIIGLDQKILKFIKL